MMQKHKIFESLEEAKNQIPLNMIYSLRIDFRNICIVRNEIGFFALEDACPHKLIKLSKGNLNKLNQIECTWHGYTFDVETGKEMTGKNIRNVKTFELEANEEGYFILLPKEEETRDEFSY